MKLSALLASLLVISVAADGRKAFARDGSVDASRRLLGSGRRRVAERSEKERNSKAIELSAKERSRQEASSKGAERSGKERQTKEKTLKVQERGGKERSSKVAQEKSAKERGYKICGKVRTSGSGNGDLWDAHLKSIHSMLVNKCGKSCQGSNPTDMVKVAVLATQANWCDTPDCQHSDAIQNSASDGNQDTVQATTSSVQNLLVGQAGSNYKANNALFAHEQMSNADLLELLLGGAVQQQGKGWQSFQATVQRMPFVMPLDIAYTPNGVSVTQALAAIVQSLQFSFFDPKTRLAVSSESGMDDPTAYFTSLQGASIQDTQTRIDGLKKQLVAAQKSFGGVFRDTLRRLNRVDCRWASSSEYGIAGGSWSVLWNQVQHGCKSCLKNAAQACRRRRRCPSEYLCRDSGFKFTGSIAQGKPRQPYCCPEMAEGTDMMSKYRLAKKAVDVLNAQIASLKGSLQAKWAAQQGNLFPASASEHLALNDELSSGGVFFNFDERLFAHTVSQWRAGNQLAPVQGKAPSASASKQADLTSHPAFGAYVSIDGASGDSQVFANDFSWGCESYLEYPLTAWKSNAQSVDWLATWKRFKERSTDTCNFLPGSPFGMPGSAFGSNGLLGVIPKSVHLCYRPTAEMKISKAASELIKAGRTLRIGPFTGQLSNIAVAGTEECSRLQIKSSSTVPHIIGFTYTKQPACGGGWTVCASSEGSTCTCTGDVLYGRKYGPGPIWTATTDAYSGGFAAGVREKFTLAKAKEKCRSLGAGSVCKAVTCTRASNSCTVRGSSVLTKASSHEVSYTYAFSAACCSGPIATMEQMKAGNKYKLRSVVGSIQCSDSAIGNPGLMSDVHKYCLCKPTGMY